MSSNEEKPLATVHVLVPRNRWMNLTPGEFKSLWGDVLHRALEEDAADYGWYTIQRNKAVIEYCILGHKSAGVGILERALLKLSNPLGNAG